MTTAGLTCSIVRYRRPNGVPSSGGATSARTRATSAWGDSVASSSPASSAVSIATMSSESGRSHASRKLPEAICRNSAPVRRPP